MSKVLAASEFKLGAATGQIGEVEIVSTALQKEAVALRDGKHDDTDHFFGQQVALEKLLNAGSGRLTVATLFERLRDIGREIQRAGVAESTGTHGAGASIEALSEARNSLLLRWRPDALAAIQDAYALFSREMAYTHYAVRVPLAYELRGNLELRTLCKPCGAPQGGPGHELVESVDAVLQSRRMPPLYGLHWRSSCGVRPPMR